MTSTTKKSLILLLTIAAFFGSYFIFQPLANAQSEIKGIWIEAENAVSYNTRLGVSNPMAREKNPSWRPPYFGDGSWYMGAGGDYLNYEFLVSQSGKYNVWVRDYVDKFQPKGVRRIIIEFDGKRYGAFPEVNIFSEGAKGAFGWHKVGGGIELETGLCKMKIIKEATTAGAAVLDTFYLTLSNETPPKKSAEELIQEASIQYPIVELGNCQNEIDCKNYCSKTENILVCATFGEKMGLISPENAKRAKEFADILKGEGPGGCKTPDECKNYCNDISRINECVGFAKKHNFISQDQLQEAQKIMKALGEGAKLPGGCRDKNSCENYCKNLSNAEECFLFAEKAGFVSPAEAEQARKVLPFISRGETPGKCKTKQECESYCSNENNMAECVGFAEKAGFISKEEADLAKKVGGEGPSGCKSKETCDAYCNKKENQKECFSFAKKYDLIPAEKLKEIEDGMGRLRSGLDQMPSEAIQCLKDNLGEGVIGEIVSGNFMPGPDTGDIIKGCFDKVLPQLQAKLQQGLQQATPETLTCLKSGLGEDAFNKIQSGEAPTPENGDVLKKCFESMKVEGMKKLQSGLDKMPAEMKNCVKEKIGADKFAKIEKGESVEIGPEVENIIQGCVADFKSVIQSKIDQAMGQVPPEVKSCVQSKISGIEDKIKSGEIKESDIPGLIQECVPSMGPGDIPGSSGGANVPGNIPSGSSGSQGPDCSSFTSVPSCSYVPESVRSACSKCKGE